MIKLHKPECVLENVTHKIFLGFEIKKINESRLENKIYFL